MKTFSQAVLLSTVSLVIATAALANSQPAQSTLTVKTLPPTGTVSLSGTVDSVQDERNFTLRDRTGASTIGVELQSNQSVVLKPGDSVTVNGAVDKGLLGTDINASSVIVMKDPVQALGEVVEGTTNLSFENAASTSIGHLPAEGKVKIMGRVTEVADEKNFTLTDDTGKVNVEVKSGQSAAITKGAEVTVLGFVDKGLLGASIDATNVIVTADAAK